MELTSLGTAQFIALETFKRDGTGVITPVWVTAYDEKLYVWTIGNSWKVKRIRKNDLVRLAESDGRGNPKSEWVTGHARVLDSDADKHRVLKLFKDKYGFQFTLYHTLEKIRGTHNRRVAIEISS